MLVKAAISVSFLALSIGLAFSDAIGGSDTCSLSNIPGSTASQTGQFGCTIHLLNPDGATGSSTASTAAVMDMPALGNPSSPVGASLRETVYALPADDFVVRQIGTADATISVDYTFTTTGPTRSGFIQINQRNDAFVSFTSGGDEPYVESADVSVGNLGESCLGMGSAGESCSGNLINPSTRFAFTLGETFDFQEDLTLDAASYPLGDEIEDGIANTNFTFELFESDGITPVQLISVPEPVTFAMSGLGLAALLGLRRTRT